MEFSVFPNSGGKRDYRRDLFWGYATSFEVLVSPAGVKVPKGKRFRLMLSFGRLVGGRNSAAPKGFHAATRRAKRTRRQTQRLSSGEVNLGGKDLGSNRKEKKGYGKETLNETVNGDSLTETGDDDWLNRTPKRGRR